MGILAVDVMQRNVILMGGIWYSEEKTGRGSSAPRPSSLYQM